MTEPAPELKKKTAGVIAPPPLIYAGALALCLALDAAFGGPATGLSETARLTLGSAIFVLGFALPLLGAVKFRRAGTEVRPWMPSTALVTTGIYRYTRNPMYLGMALIYCAIAIMADSVVAVAGLVPLLAVIQYGVIKREEHYLEITFGQPYRDYKQRVRRWL